MYLNIKATRQTELYVGSLPGSYEDIISRVHAAVREKFMKPPVPVANFGPETAKTVEVYTSVCAVFPTHCIFKLEVAGKDTYFSAPWSVDSTGAVQIGDPTPMAVTFVPKPAMETGKRNSATDEKTLLEIVERAVYLLGAEKVIATVREVSATTPSTAKLKLRML
jgi:hypothetical protein